MISCTDEKVTNYDNYFTTNLKMNGVIIKKLKKYGLSHSLTTSQIANCLSFILENPVEKSMFMSPKKTTWEPLLPGCPTPC